MAEYWCYSRSCLKSPSIYWSWFQECVLSVLETVKQDEKCCFAWVVIRCNWFLNFRRVYWTSRELRVSGLTCAWEELFWETFISNLLRNRFFLKKKNRRIVCSLSLKGIDFCYRWNSLCPLMSYGMGSLNLFCSVEYYHGILNWFCQDLKLCSFFHREDFSLSGSSLHNCWSVLVDHDP